ncbi:MAG TPA: thioredoxin family protein [Verrucomicrobiae bacterium]|nr:thioredoxin family protein [Verrucomicrobiae bacterium]
MKGFIACLWCFGLALGTRADLIQLNTGKRLSGRVASYANDTFQLERANAEPIQVPASSVSGIDFSKGTVHATIEMADRQSLTGQIWLYARGALNFDDDKGMTTRIPLTKVSRVSFGKEPVPEKPAASSSPKPGRSSTGSSAADPKVEIISRGEQVDIGKRLVPGKITIVDFYADWCAPCRSIEPMLEERVNKDADLVLRKINIDNWASPVSKQYGIRAVPFLQVYDRRGNKIGDVTGFNSTFFESLISRAR